MRPAIKEALTKSHMRDRIAFVPRLCDVARWNQRPRQQLASSSAQKRSGPSKEMQLGRVVSAAASALLRSLPRYLPWQRCDASHPSAPDTTRVARLSQCFLKSTLCSMFWILLALATPFAQAEDDLLPPEKAFKFSAVMAEPGIAEVRYQIADGYYMYRDKFRFSAQPAGASLGEPQLPAGKIKEDEYFGKVETYRHEVAIRVPVTAAAGANEVTLQAISQGCADAGLCYSPFKQSARLILAAAGTSDAGSTKTDDGGALSKLRALTRSSDKDDFLPVDKAFKIQAKVIDAQTVAIEFKPEPTYYLYRDKLGVDLPKDSRMAIAKAGSIDGP